MRSGRSSRATRQISGPQGRPSRSFIGRSRSGWLPVGWSSSTRRTSSATPAWPSSGARRRPVRRRSRFSSRFLRKPCCRAMHPERSESWLRTSSSGTWRSWQRSTPRCWPPRASPPYTSSERRPMSSPSMWLPSTILDAATARLPAASKGSTVPGGPGMKGYEGQRVGVRAMAWAPDETRMRPSRSARPERTDRWTPTSGISS